MKRVQYHSFGGPEVLRLDDVEVPRPGPGQVLVRVVAAAVNPLDRKLRAGAMKVVSGLRFPQAFGHDFAGVVESCGAGVERLRAGDEVIGAAPVRAAGAFAEFVLVDEPSLAAKPPNLTFAAAAALPTPAVTAYQALVVRGGLSSGQMVFVHGCLGAVGRCAVAIALAAGAGVAGSCRDGTQSLARDLGVGPVVGFDVDPSALTEPHHVVLDTAGTLRPAVARAILAPGGTVVDINPGAAKFAKALVCGSYQVLVSKVGGADLEQVARLAGTGALNLPIARTVPLAEAVPAMVEFEQRRSSGVGKLVVTCG